MLQFGARVVDAELPVDPGLFAIAFLGPGRRFRRDQSSALDPAIQALAVQRTELQFRNVQPAPVFRRVHQVDAVVQPTGFGRRERGVERVTAVGVQVVAHQRDAFRIPVTRQIRQCACLLRPIQRRAPFGDSQRPPAGLAARRTSTPCMLPGGGSGRRTSPATRGVPETSRGLPTRAACSSRPCTPPDAASRRAVGIP